MEAMKGEKLFEINEHWTFELFRNANIIFQKKIRKNLLFCNIVSLFVALYNFCAFAWLFFAKGKFSIVCLVCCLVGVILFFLVPARFKKSIEEAWKTAPDMDGYDETIEFYEDGFLIKRSDVEVKHLYEKYDCMIEKSGYLFLRLSKNHAYIIQKSMCSEELVAFLNQRINGNIN